MDIKAKRDSDAGKPGIRSTRQWFVWVCAVACLISGVFSSMSFKIMNRMDSPVRDGEMQPFTGAVLQSFLMFIGESLCLVTWWIDSWISKRQGYYPLFDFIKCHDDMKGKTSPWYWWAIPAILDSIATTMINLAVQITYASTVQMLRNFMIVIGAILQLIIVRKALKVHEYIGVVFITAAMFLAAVPAIMNPDESGLDDSSPILGIIFALVGTSVQSLQLIFEDYLFRNKGRIGPLKAVGYEGVTGLVVTCALMMPIAQYTGFDPVWDSFHQWVNNGAILGVSIGYIFVALTFNASGLSCTKLASGLLRAVIFAVRAPLVWFVELGLGWIDFDGYNLGSVFVFAFGFFMYVHLIPWRKLICGESGDSFDGWLRNAPQWCCTDPALDGDYYSTPSKDEEKNDAIREQSINDV